MWLLWRRWAEGSSRDDWRLVWSSRRKSSLGLCGDFDRYRRRVSLDEVALVVISLAGGERNLSEGVLDRETGGVSPFHFASSLENISSSLRYFELELDRGATVSTCLGSVSERERLAEVWAVAASFLVLSADLVSGLEPSLAEPSLAELEPEPEPDDVSQLEPELVPELVLGSLPDDTPDENPESRPSTPLGESSGRLVDTCSDGSCGTFGDMSLVDEEMSGLSRFFSCCVVNMVTCSLLLGELGLLLVVCLRSRFEMEEQARCGRRVAYESSRWMDGCTSKR